MHGSASVQLRGGSLPLSLRMCGLGSLPLPLRGPRESTHSTMRWPRGKVTRSAQK